LERWLVVVVVDVGVVVVVVVVVFAYTVKPVNSNPANEDIL
jgi:hypothetical protein